MQIGGDAEGYMDAPSLSGGGGKKGGGGFFASLLDALGIHTQVANQSGGKSEKTALVKDGGLGGVEKTKKSAVVPPPEVQQVTRRFLDSLGETLKFKPRLNNFSPGGIQPIDPDQIMREML